MKVTALEKEAKEKQQEHSKALNQLHSVNREIKGLQESKVIVSEHAILRYLERVMNVDIEQIRSLILTEDNVTLIENMGSGKYPIGNGMKAVVKNKTVVSVV